MPQDLFGDLQQWGLVLDTLDRLQRDRTVEEHQSGLTRIIRYRSNWRLQREALRCARLICGASPALKEAVLSVLTDADAYLENRAIAADVLGRLFTTNYSDPVGVDAHGVTRTMADLMADREIPLVLRCTLRATCAQTRSTASGRGRNEREQL